MPLCGRRCGWGDGCYLPVRACFGRDMILSVYVIWVILVKNDNTIFGGVLL